MKQSECAAISSFIYATPDRAVLGVPSRVLRAESGTENRNYKGNGEYKLFRETEKRRRTLATTHAKRHNGSRVSSWTVCLNKQYRVSCHVLLLIHYIEQLLLCQATPQTGCVRTVNAPLMD